MHNHMRESSRLWDYEVLQELGRGQYGQVFKVRNKKDSLIYALKKVNIASAHQKQKIQAFRQIKALKMIKHPDIIEYYDSFLSMDNIYIVMEYAAKGDFSRIVKERRMKEKPFSELELWNIFATIANAVKYLHQLGIIHRDLKLENIFLTEQGKVKIGDLGMSKVIHDPNELISQRVGTPVYFAPEIIQHQLYSYPVDIWALGCVFYYLAMLQHPFKEATIETLPYFVIEKDPKPIKGNYGGYLINFINSLLTKNAKTRPTIFQANLTIKNRENPNPQNRVRVFDFKKLLLMKPDLNKLEQMKKSYSRPTSITNNISASSSPTNERYQSSTDIRSYRDYMKINLSLGKIASKQETEIDSPSPRRRIKKMANISVVIPAKKPDQKQQQPSSPIKTNGFSDFKAIPIKNELANRTSYLVDRTQRNYGAFRQQARKPCVY